MILDFLVDFVFPKFCVVCDKEGSFLCRKCKKNLPSALQVCPMCTRPSIYGLTHEYCHKKHGLDGLMAIFDYKNEAVRKLVEAVKFGFNQELVAIVLSGWKKPRNWGKKVVLVPVPLHRYRENWRGFNQAEVFAKVVGGEKMEIVKVLVRIKATAQQANIRKRRERSENIKGSFQIREGMGKELKNKKVILIDDVFTSGATMRECTKELKKVGVGQVWGLVLAR